MWIGLNDIATESKNVKTKFAWLNGDQYDPTQAYWRPNEPNGSDGEDCIGNSRDGQWADYPCSYTLYFACNLEETGGTSDASTAKLSILSAIVMVFAMIFAF